jgi:hypothetical protein
MVRLTPNITLILIGLQGLHTGNWLHNRTIFGPILHNGTAGTLK